MLDGCAPRCAVFDAKLKPRIFFDGHLLSGLLVPRFDLDGIFARLNKRPARAKIVTCSHGLELLGRGLGGRVVAKVPIGAIDSRGSGPFQFADHFSLFIGNRYFDLGFFLLRGLFFLSSFWRLRRLLCLFGRSGFFLLGAFFLGSSFFFLFSIRLLCGFGFRFR